MKRRIYDLTVHAERFEAVSPYNFREWLRFLLEREIVALEQEHLSSSNVGRLADLEAQE